MEKQRSAAQEQLTLWLMQQAATEATEPPSTIKHWRSIQTLRVANALKKQNDNKLSLTLFWTKVDADDASNRFYKCKLCGISRKLNKSGNTNSVDHLNERHPKWKEVLERARPRKSVKGVMDAFLQPQLDSKFKNIFRWLQWIIKKAPFYVRGGQV